MNHINHVSSSETERSASRSEKITLGHRAAIGILLAVLGSGCQQETPQPTQTQCPPLKTLLNQKLSEADIKAASNVPEIRNLIITRYEYDAYLKRNNCTDKDSSGCKKLLDETKTLVAAILSSVPVTKKMKAQTTHYKTHPHMHMIEPDEEPTPAPTEPTLLPWEPKESTPTATEPTPTPTDTTKRSRNVPEDLDPGF